MATATIPHIDEQRLEQDLGYRFGYLAEFMEFGPDDIECIKASAEWLGPLLPSIVDAVYVKLFSFDATKRHFVARQTGYEGELPRSIDDLSLDHEQIQFRKHHLGKYLARLVTGAYDPRMVSYLDFVGKMHTPKAGSKDLNVPLVQMNALMGLSPTRLSRRCSLHSSIAHARQHWCARLANCCGYRMTSFRAIT